MDIKSLIKKIKKVEESKDFATLDAKLAQKLSSLGVSESEKSSNLVIAKKIEKGAFAESKGGKKFVFGSLALLTSFIFLFGILYLVGVFRQQDKSISDYKILPAAPAMSIEPQQFTQSGYLTQDSTFTLEINGEIKGNINKIVRIEPETEIVFEATKDSAGNQQILIKPESSLIEGQEYSIIIPAGTKFSNGAVLENDLVWKYTVNPKFALLATTPRNNTTNVPYDSTIEFEFNKKNVDINKLTDYIDVYPQISGKFTQYGTKVLFMPETPFLINTDYSVVVKKGIATLDGETIDYDSKFTFRTTDQDRAGKVLDDKQFIGTNYLDSTHMSINDKIFERFYYSGFPSDTVFTINIYSIGADDLIENILYTDGILKAIPDSAKIVYTKDYPYGFGNFDFEYKPVQDGQYILQYKNSKNSRQKLIVYSYSQGAVFSSYLDGKLEGWVWNMDKEQLIGDAQIVGYNSRKTKFTYGSNNEKIADCTASTNKKGYFKMDNCDILKVTSPVGTIVVSNRANVSFYDQTTVRTNAALVDTDKMIYAPGDTVNYSIFVKKLEGNIQSEELEGEQMTVYIKEGTAVLKRKDYVLDNQFGYIEDNFDLLANTQSKSYEIVVEYQGLIIGREFIMVEPNTQSDYIYDLQIDKQKLVANEKVKIDFSGEDYAGMPLISQEMRVVVYEGDFQYSWLETSGRNYDDFIYDLNSVFYGYGDGEAVSIYDEKITLDKNGKWSTDYQVKLNDNSSPFKTLILQVRNAQDSIVAQKLLLVSNYTVNIRFAENGIASSYQENKPVEIVFLADQIWSGKPLNGVEFSAKLIKNVREYVTGEPYYDDETKSMIYPGSYVVNKKVIAEKEFITDDKGQAVWRFDELIGGSYDIVIYAKNSDLVKQYLGAVYVTSFGSGGGDYKELLSISANNDAEVKPGQEIEYTVKSDVYKNATIFVQTDKIGDWSTVTFDKSTTGKIKIPNDARGSVGLCAYSVGLSPSNFYDKEVASKNPNKKMFIMQCTYVSFDGPGTVLDIDMKTQKIEYKPDEEVILNIKSKKDGQGTPALINLYVVDKRVADLSFGYTTNSINNPFYDFDSGYWSKYFGSTPIFDNVGPDYYGDDVGFTDEINKTGSISKNNRNFINLGAVYTDQSGNGTIRFKMPNNLTKWVITATATNPQDLYGQNSVEIVSRLDKFVDVNTPEYVRSSDKTEISLIVKNYSDKFEAEVGFECTGCVTKDWKEEIIVDKQEVKVINVPIEILETGSNNKLKIYPYIKIGDKKTEQTPVMIPIYNSGKTKNESISGLLDSNVGEVTIDANLGEISEEFTSVDVCLSPSFPVTDFISISSAQLKSTNDLANSILFYSYMYKNYDSLEITDYQKADLYKKIQDYYEMLIQNQTEIGGFGWFDYDAENIESSVFAAQALDSMQKNGISVDYSRIERLKAYFIFILGDEKYTLEQKIVALYGLSYLDKAIVIQYMPVVRESFENSELVNSPVAISSLMLTYNNIGSTGNAQELVKYLLQTVKSGDRYAYWEDVDSLYKNIAVSDIVTSNVYLSLAPLDQWQLKYKVRSWLLDRNMQFVNSRQDYKRISYVLALAEEGRINSIVKSGTMEILVNGEKLADAQVKEKGCIYSIDPSKLKNGSNEIKLKSDNLGELFVLIKIVKQDEAQGDSGGNIVREYYDLDTNKQVLAKDLKEGKYYVVKINIEDSKNKNEIVVKDEVPSGLDVFDGGFFSIPSEVRNKYYKDWGFNSTYTYNYGVTTISPYYSSNYNGFNYLVRAKSLGDFDGGTSTYYILGADEINGVKANERVIISKNN